MKTSNTSIAAILFTITYFLFIIFISLFKGLHFYDIKLHNLYIKHFFLKIDKKLILKANSITIIPQQKVKKDITSIHKQIYYISKISSVFEEFTLKNIKYKKFKIPLISYRQKQINIIFPNLKVTGSILTYKDYTIINKLLIKYKNYIFSDINGKIKYKKNISFKINGNFYKNKILLQGKLDKYDNLYFTLKANNFQYHINGYQLFLAKPYIKASFNLHYFNPFIKLKAQSAYLRTKEFFTKIQDIYAKYTKNTLSFNIFNIYISQINTLKNINIDYVKGIYYKKDHMLIISQNNNINFSYKDFNILLKNNQLIYKSLNNFHFTSKKAVLKNNNFIVTSKNILILKYNDFITYKIKNSILKSKLINAVNDIIYGYKNSIEIPNIKGHYKNIDFKIQNTLINLKLKKAVIADIKINNIKISPSIIKWNFPSINISAYSNDIKLDNRLKKLLKEFNISVPPTQIQGINEINATVIYNIKSKDFNFTTDINSTNSIFKYEHYLFKYKKLLAHINKQKITSTIKNFYIPTDFGKLKMDSNLTVTKTYLNSFTKINQLKILNFVKIKNYNEKIVADFINKTIYFLNSNIYINLKNQTIFFLSLKKIIHFTPFYPLVKNGGIYLKYNNGFIIISGILELTKPLILNQKDPNLLNALIKIKDKNITVMNNYILTKITDLKEYNVSIKNAIIDVKTLMYIYEHLQPIFEENQTSENNTSLFIKSKNTNFVYENHKFLSQKAFITYKKELKIKSYYKQSSLYGYTKNGYFLMEGKNYSKEELVPLLEFFKKFKSINLDFVFVRSPDDFYTGKVYVKKGIVKELTALNNIIAFLNTIPSLLSLSNPGFSAKGYKIKKGFINYLFYKNILYFKQIKIIGENIDFIGKGYIDFNKDYINLKLTANLKMKLKKIPIVGKGVSYILFGKDGSINVKIVVKGPLENPKVTQDIGKSILLTPFELFKRVITLPFNLF